MDGEGMQSFEALTRRACPPSPERKPRYPGISELMLFQNGLAILLRNKSKILSVLVGSHLNFSAIRASGGCFK
jgi:hypothetical protein